MKESTSYLQSQRGSAGVKFVLLIVIIGMLAHAGLNYVPIAYNGAAFKQEMDTAVVKGLATSGRLKPVEVVTAHIKHAASAYDIPDTAIIEVSQVNGQIEAHATYEQAVNILPFGVYKYSYKFDYTATPTGYLLKDAK